MKRMNNKGVVLLETLIVSVFVISICIFVYRNVVPMIGRYEKLELFDDVDSVYAANLIKNLVVSNIDLDEMDKTVVNSCESTGDKCYVDISDCNDESLYIDTAYCKKIKESLHMTDNDIMYLTGYSARYIGGFKKYINSVEIPEVEKKYSGGEFGKFRDYLKTVANAETFYSKNVDANTVAGKYRVFISRNVRMMDGSSIKKYANIGIYKKN